MTTTERRTVSTAVRSSQFLSRVGHVSVLHAQPLRETTTGNLLTTGSNQLLVRDHNQLLVLQAIRVQSALTRRALAQATGLTFQTVENISRRLIDAGIVQDGQPENQEGRSRHLSLRPSGAHAIGISFAPFSCDVALCDFDGRAVATTQLRIDEGADPADVLRRLSRTVPDLVDDANVPVSTVLGAGIITPTFIDEHDQPCVRWPSQAEIAQQLRMPILTSSSVLAAVCGEQWTGHLTARDAVYVHLGAAIAGAIVSNGQLITGATGGSGDIAHLCAERDGPLCGCGRRGCLCTLISETRLRDSAGQAIGAPEPPSLAAVATLAGTDPAVAAVVRHAAERLIHALIPAVQVLDPEVIVLGGPTADALGELLRARISELLATARGPVPAVELARPIAGQAASAATLVLQQVFTPTVDHLLLGRASMQAKEATGTAG
jgi:predicted NBD/HSP70 family sugar kinase